MRHPATTEAVHWVGRGLGDSAGNIRPHSRWVSTGCHVHVQGLWGSSTLGRNKKSLRNANRNERSQGRSVSWSTHGRDTRPQKQH